MIRPNPLKKGDRLAVIGASSPTSTAPDVLASAVEKMGFEPVLFTSATAKHNYLSGTDELRAHDINAAFADDSIQGIVSTRGGYGSHRVLPLLDYEMIKKHPKFFGGYSDITAYICAINQICGFEAYHMPMVGAWASGMDIYTESYVKAMLFGEKIEYKNPAGCRLLGMNGGKAEGIICGGNLSLIASSLGTPYEMDTKGKILFIEEVGEAPYHVDKMLTHMRNAGKFDDAAGIIFGQFTECSDKDGGSWNVSMDQIIYELVVPSGKPIIKGVMCGHGTPTMSLPMGRKFFMDANSCEFGETE